MDHHWLAPNTFLWYIYQSIVKKLAWTGSTQLGIRKFFNWSFFLWEMDGESFRVWRRVLIERVSEELVVENYWDWEIVVHKKYRTEFTDIVSMKSQFCKLEQNYVHSQLSVCIDRVVRKGLTSLSEAPSHYNPNFEFKYWVRHCSWSVDTFVSILATSYSCEGCDCGNKPIDLPIHSRNVVDFSSSLFWYPFLS